ncbi:hypothetical protein AX17_004434 [Amanita inopinata Kibby_2008]|nr:hypothetical protein AX17_004434 [Amanita inopinata Kibby_2008]
MLFTTTLMNLCLLFAFSLFTLVSSLPLVARDVYVPPILTPTKGDQWVIGERRNVTWDVSDPPMHITNPIGQIYLRKGDRTFMNFTLASNFSILLGSIEVQVPAVLPDDDYRVVLFGDSGNWSPTFSIISNDTAPPCNA